MAAMKAGCPGMKFERPCSIGAISVDTSVAHLAGEALLRAGYPAGLGTLKQREELASEVRA